MSPENTQQLGLILTIVGLALALIGYAIYLNLRAGRSKAKDQDEEQRPEESADAASADAGSADEPSGGGGPDWARDLANEVLVEPDMGLAASEKASDSSVSHAGADGNKEEIAQKRDPFGEMNPSDPEYVPVATVLRQIDSGELKIRVGGNEYASVEELRESGDWPKIRRLPTDLLTWMEGSAKSTARGRTVRPETSSEAQGPESQTMISQINKIIKDKTEGNDPGQPSIRIVEGMGGALRVYVGVESFPFDEIPYEHVRTLIRESVEEWEASQ